jgi:hypothetical protein
MYLMGLLWGLYEEGGIICIKNINYLTRANNIALGS